MAKDSKRGLFSSMFGSKKKTEEELEAEEQSRQKIENRIREALAVSDSTKLDLALELECDARNVIEIRPIAESAPPLAEPAPESTVPSDVAPEEEYRFLYLSTGTDNLRKPPSPSRYRAQLETRASQAR